MNNLKLTLSLKGFRSGEREEGLVVDVGRHEPPKVSDVARFFGTRVRTDPFRVSQTMAIPRFYALGKN